MKSIKNNIYLKMGAIVIVALLLLIPKAKIKNIIREREQTQNEAIHEVSSKWSEKQTITGPFVSIPYYKYIKKQSEEEGVKDEIVRIKDHIHILPAKLEINGIIMPDKRYRGIYEVVVYDSKLNFKGSFEFNNSKIDIPSNNILTENAFISLGIDDLRGVEEQITLEWDDKSHPFNPVTVTTDIITSGINTKIPVNLKMQSRHEFSFDIKLKGSELLYFVPVGKLTKIHLESPWDNPSFDGAFLPDSRKITNNGFNANWKILNLNRNFPQLWIGDNYNIKKSAFGVKLLLPIDSYQKSMRTIKYSILFIALTFLVFFFVEIMQKKFIHPIQYILVGFALIIFYTLLISISEHINFDFSYIISALSTLLLVFFYVKAILKSNAISLIIGAILLILYGFIFVIIQLQDYSLLIGSIGLFIILGLVMYFTRKIDWYNINMERKNL